MWRSNPIAGFLTGESHRPEGLDLVVRGRLALPGREPAAGQLGLAGGRIGAVAGPEVALPALRELDCGDALILPGVVDVHVHTGSAAEEGIGACTRAAAAGGVTTLVDMPTTTTAWWPTPMPSQGPLLRLEVLTAVRWRADST